MSRAFAWRSFALALVFSSPLGAAPRSLELLPRERGDLVKKLATHRGTVSVSAGNELEIRLDPGPKGSWVGFPRATLDYPGDWTGHAYLVLRVRNPLDRPQDIGVTLTSSEGRKQGVARLPSGATTRILVPTGGRREIVGMRGQPPHPMTGPDDEVVDLRGWSFDGGDMRSFAITSGDSPVTVTLLSAELAGEVSVARESLVDRFGQFNGADWPGKLQDASDFPERRRAEQADWDRVPVMPGLSRWGGWAEGPQLEATGRFRAAKHEGKWWLVDPDGHLFWSSGLDCVRLSSRPSLLQGRKDLFEWLPEPGEPLARFYSGNRMQFDFHGANLYRKYGESYAERFFDTALARFRSWGLNTVGNWSDYEVFASRGGMAYTASLPYGANRFVAREFVKAGKTKKKWFPDPFDPGFVPALKQAMRERLGEWSDDPWLLGVFIDNELDWGHGQNRISATSFTNPPETPLKRALVARLRERFAHVGEINERFGTEFASWGELEQPVEFTPEQRRNNEALFADLDSYLAEQYFRGCREAMDEVLPGVLYLGPRFHGNVSEEVMEAAAVYCDVVSYNIYDEMPGNRRAIELAWELDFPVIIGEWHFGATDRGMFHPGLVPARDQADRAAKFSAYLRSAIVSDWCVGAHWFQYLDQPLTGRFDGENYAIGFVDVTDDPYPEMVAAAREVHAAMYPLRAAGE